MFFLRKGDSSGNSVERSHVHVIEALSEKDCPDLGTSETDTLAMGTGCQCRKCSLISLGDVDTREVHSMIKFMKQNKV